MRFGEKITPSDLERFQNGMDFMHKMKNKNFFELKIPLEWGIKFRTNPNFKSNF